MDGIADMGGTDGWGPVRAPRADEPVFDQSWQGRAFAMAILSSRLACGGPNPDAFRHALERLDRAAYLDDGYYGRWLNGAELMLTESAFLAPGALEARARNLRGEHVEEPSVRGLLRVFGEPDTPGVGGGSDSQTGVGVRRRGGGIGHRGAFWVGCGQPSKGFCAARCAR